MDRNFLPAAYSKAHLVALRKESVDRNIDQAASTVLIHVALRKESVDRNSIGLASIRACILSLSARRAWIEIAIVSIVISCIMGSLSARRAWIEIAIANTVISCSMGVALRKESVDRNYCWRPRHSRYCRRSPQGERG